MYNVRMSTMNHWNKRHLEAINVFLLKRVCFERKNTEQNNLSVRAYLQSVSRNSFFSFSLCVSPYSI